jgi:hypothetical protein
MIRRLTGNVAGILVIGLVLTSTGAGVAEAEVLCWDFVVHPTQETAPMIGYVHDGDPGGGVWDGTTTGWTPYGDCVPGTGLQGDGTAIFADAPCENANSGFVYGLTGSTGSFTLDVRVKVLENVTQGNGKSMTIKNDTQQRGIKLQTDRVELVNGSGVVGTWLTGLDLASAFKILRFSVNATTVDNVVTVYMWDAGSSTWTTLGNTTLGGSGGGGEVPQNGIGIGSLAGSSTMSGKFIIDWARVNPTTALGTSVGPLPACISVCGIGVAPGAVQTPTGYAGGGAAVMTNLGSPDYVNGLNVLPNNAGFDGNTQVAVVGGRSCKQNVAGPGGNYIFFAVDDAFIYQGNHPAVFITVSYYDAASGTLALQYDAGPGNEYKDGGAITLSGTNQWTSHTWTVTDAYFGTGEAWGGDFRFGTGGVPVAVDSVVVAYLPGPEIDYTITNIGDSTVNWAVAKVAADGVTPAVYNWLNLDSTGGQLIASASALLKASIDTTALGAGAQPPAYLKFTDTCDLPAAFSEPFSYSDGSLIGQDSWTLTAGSASPFNVDTGRLKLDGSGDSTPGVWHTATRNLASGGTEGEYSVKLKLARGPNDSNNFWDFHVKAGTQDLAIIQGKAQEFLCKNPSNINDATGYQALTSTPTLLEIKIKTAGSKTVEYWWNGTKLNTTSGTCNHNGVGGVSGVAFDRISGASSSGLTDWVYIDDLSVTVTAAYQLREIDLNVIGCSLAVVPRAALPVTGCSGTATRTFSVINNGVFDITSFTVQQADPVTGNPYPTPVPWLTLPNTTGLTIPSGGSVDVTVGIDLAQASGTEKATLQFSTTCSSGTARDTLVDALTVTKLTAGGTILRYKGDKDPLLPGSMGSGGQFSEFEGTQVGTVVTDPDATDRFAYELNDLSTGKTKFISEPPATFANGATLVVRMKKLADASYPGGRYGNIWIHAPNISAEIFWGGPSGELGDKSREVWTTLSADQGADANYHTIRVTTQDTGGSTGIVVNVYFDENPVPVLSITNAAAVGPQGSSHNGFGFGTQGTSNIEHIFVDCLSATTAGAFAPGEEVACLGESLTCPDLCHRPYADVDDDGDVDQADFSVFQLCFTGPDVTVLPPGLPEYCACLDHADDDNNSATPPTADGNIDSFDLSAFEKCASGPGIPANPSCGD